MLLFQIYYIPLADRQTYKWTKHQSITTNQVGCLNLYVWLACHLFHPVYDSKCAKWHRRETPIVVWVALQCPSHYMLCGNQNHKRIKWHSLLSAVNTQEESRNLEQPTWETSWQLRSTMGAWHNWKEEKYLQRCTCICQTQIDDILSSSDSAASLLLDRSRGANQSA
jgi:hypothetical protein